MVLMLLKDGKLDVLRLPFALDLVSRKKKIRDWTKRQKLFWREVWYNILAGTKIRAQPGAPTSKAPAQPRCTSIFITIKANDEAHMLFHYQIDTSLSPHAFLQKIRTMQLIDVCFCFVNSIAPAQPGQFCSSKIHAIWAMWVE